MSIWSDLFKRAQKSPHLIIPGLYALLNGYWYKFKFFITFKKVKIGKAFRVYGKLRILGPGKVVIGDNCIVISNLIKSVTIMTALPKAEVIVGNSVGFNGTVIQCYESIVIEDLCNISDAYIVDSQAHHLSSDRRFLSDETVYKNPVRIRRNVWVSVNVVISHGVTIGENSVIGACSLVNKEIPENCLYAGYPAKFIKTIND